MSSCVVMIATLEKMMMTTTKTSPLIQPFLKQQHRILISAQQSLTQQARWRSVKKCDIFFTLTCYDVCVYCFCYTSAVKPRAASYPGFVQYNPPAQSSNINIICKSVLSRKNWTSSTDDDQWCKILVCFFLRVLAIYMCMFTV